MCYDAASGDSSKIDLTVGDIYGGKDYSGIGLSKHMIASSFGKFKDVKMPIQFEG
jgi:type II pantothenate kinase